MNGEDRPVAVVTGGGRNIGRAIALELARWGADVAIMVRSDLDAAEKVAAEVRALGRAAVARTADVRDESAVAGVVGEVSRTLGPPVVLVNNAAIRPEAPFTELTYDDWREVTGVILDGAYVCSRAVIPAMLEAGHGRIVNIAGLSGQTGASDRAHVVAAKSGLIGLTKALAVEYAGRGITVNAVSPGLIDTARVGEAPRHYAGKTIPVGRKGRPEDVAGMVRFLVSEEGAYMTGQTINVNGGLAF